LKLSQNEINEIYKIIGKNVKKIRMEKGLSQLELSLELGYKSVSVVAFGEICKNNKHFNISQLVNISKVLKVDICKFFEGIESV